METSGKNIQLIQRVLDTVDWVTILKFYKLVKRSIGSETAGIPGIKKIKKGEKLTADHIKEEVRCLIYHVVENDISDFVYGPWNILWVNGEWEVEMDTGLSGENEFFPILESVLELSFSPMVVISKENLTYGKDLITIDPDKEILKRQLEKAIEEEKYELASKIKDLIEMYEKQNDKNAN